MDKLDRLVWAARSTYHIGPVHIGVRCESEWLNDVIKRALATYAVPAVESPANFSVVVSSNEGGASTGLNMLYEGHTNLVRSRHPERVLSALFQHLGKYLPIESNGYLRSSCLAMVRDGGAVLVPRGIVTWLDQIAPRLNRAGWQFVDQPWSTLDIDQSALVVPPPILDIDESWRDEIKGNSTQREPERVAAGRYPLIGWGTFSMSEEVMTTAGGTASAIDTVLNPRDLGVVETVDRIATLARRIPITGLGSPLDGDFPARLMALDPR